MYQSTDSAVSEYGQNRFKFRNSSSSAGTPILRQGRVSDAATLATIWMAARDSIPLYIRDDQYDEFVAGWSAWCRAREVWVIEVNGQIAALMRMVGSEIRYLVTAAAHARNGYAKLLIGCAKRQAVRKRFDCLTTKIKPWNEKIANLIEEIGFIYDHELTKQERWGWQHYSLQAI